MSPERFEEIRARLTWFGEAAQSYPPGNPRATAEAALELLEEVERLQERIRALELERAAHLGRST